MTERLHFHFSLLCIGEGNGNPLQCSCLENPRGGVTQSWTRLKWLSSSSSYGNLFILTQWNITHSLMFHSVPIMCQKPNTQTKLVQRECSNIEHCIYSKTSFIKYKRVSQHLGWRVLSWGGGVRFCPVHGSMFSGIPGLYQWARSTPSCLVLTTNSDTQCHMPPREQTCLWSGVIHSQHRTPFSIYSFVCNYIKTWASLAAQWWGIHPPVQEPWVQSLGWEDPPAKGMATCSSILTWEIPWTEEPGGLPSMGSQRVRHNLVTQQQQYIKTYMLKKKKSYK